jgi:hypothetical protein
MKWIELIGKKIVAFRGHKQKRFGEDQVTLHFILFDDKESYLELREQDKYDYHDCCSSARILDLHKDAEMWQKMFDKDGFEECKPEHDPF